jgi:lauroyl/myristoyl acyltransferase
MPRKRLLHRLAYTYLTLIGFFGSLLPRWLMLWFAVLIGNFYWAVMKHDREMVRRNLSRILEDPSRAGTTVRRLYMKYAKYLVDYTRMGLLEEKHLRRLVRGF